MAVAIGEIVEGVVTGITKFGAFVQLNEEESGLVHISEISHGYVEQVSDAVNKGDKVKVKVVSNDKGKIGLSMKQAQPKPERPPRVERVREEKKDVDASFEDKLSKFMKISNEKIESVRHRNNNRQGRGKRR